MVTIFRSNRQQGRLRLGLISIWSVLLLGFLVAGLVQAAVAQGPSTWYLPVIYHNWERPRPNAIFLPYSFRNVYDIEWPNVQGQLFATTLQLPTDVTHAGDGSGRLFITEQAGRVRVFDGNTLLLTPMLDIRSVVGSSEYEQGLLSIAFPPDFEAKQYFYLNYTDNNGDSRVVRYYISANNPNLADPASAEEILMVEQPGPTHNGGQLQFGPDGYLYIGFGDGDSPNDPHENAQDLSTLLGKILRIDVEGQSGPGYGVPPDNPFVDVPGARPEIWAYGLRNPWRFTVDRETGDMLIGDVGQYAYEEIDFQQGGSPGGQNYGWDCYEGNQLHEPEGCGEPSQYTFPIMTYSHEYGCSVILGYVYRGALHPRMNGLLFFSDLCSAQLFAAAQDADGRWWRHKMTWSRSAPTSFGEAEDGTLYMVTRAGRLYRLVDIAPPPR